MALTSKQKAFIDAFIEYPTLPMSQHAEHLGIAAKTVYNWKNDNKNGFRDELEARLRERWEEAKYMASETMFSLCREGDFKAAKYILDYWGYAPAQKVEAKVEQTTTIKVDIEE